MRTPSGQPYIDPGLPAEVKALRKAVDLLSRRLDRQPKIPAPVIQPSGGGIVDQARLSTNAVYPSFAGLKWPAGRRDLDYANTEYQAPYSTVTGSGISWLTIDSGEIHVTEPGWYHAWAYVRLAWATQAAAPGAGLSIYLNGHDQPNSPFYPVLDIGLGFWGVRAYVDNGIDYMTPGDYWSIEADGSADTTGDIAQSNAIWKITRYA